MGVQRESYLTLRKPNSNFLVPESIKFKPKPVQNKFFAIRTQMEAVGLLFSRDSTVLSLFGTAIGRTMLKDLDKLDRYFLRLKFSDKSQFFVIKTFKC